MGSARRFRSFFRGDSWMVAVMLAMVSLPAALTLHTVRVPAAIDVSGRNPSPYGYTVSLLLFLVPIGVIGGWLIPSDGVRISKRAFLLTIAALFPVGAILDFFFAHRFFTFPNAKATLGVHVPTMGGSVPVEEYVFYLTGFVAVLLLYIWLDEYWLRAYTVAGTAEPRARFDRLLRFHPLSVVWAVVLIGAGIVYRNTFAHAGPGFPGYLTFLVLLALLPSSVLFPSARPVINWRAFSLTIFVMLLTSLLWEATLALPYGWWGYQRAEMVGIDVTAWAGLPIEAVLVWMAVTYMTVIVYETVKRWKASGRPAREAFLGRRRGR